MPLDPVAATSPETLPYPPGRHQNLETPALLIDLAKIRDAYRHMEQRFADTSIYYAVKANPEPEIIETLAALGCCFDVASPAEVDLCLAAGVSPQKLSYGNTVKKSSDIAYAFARGVSLFAFDCPEELAKLAQAAPGARVFCRLATSSQGSSWPLARKFGCR